jgi:O-acetylhomoserine/O-acetylserine sulfhydrylase-like pyridoxal-dependent enzyme
MSSRKTCLLALLMIPNIVFASIFVTVLEVGVSTVCASVGGLLGWAGGTVGGAIYAGASEKKDSQGNFESPEEKRGERAERIVRYSGRFGALVGAVAGWQTGKTLFYPVTVTDSLVKRIRYP